MGVKVILSDTITSFLGHLFHDELCSGTLNLDTWLEILSGVGCKKKRMSSTEANLTMQLWAATTHSKRKFFIFLRPFKPKTALLIDSRKPTAHLSVPAAIICAVWFVICRISSTTCWLGKPTGSAALIQCPLCINTQQSDSMQVDITCSRVSECQIP